MLLPEGRYTIKSGDGTDRPIGLDGDRVTVLSEEDSAPEWVIEVVGSKHRIKTSDDRSVVPGDGLVWAKGDEDAKWIIESVRHHGEDNYIVKAEDGHQGWVATNPDQQDNQLMSRPLIVGPSWPPFFPPNERFIMERA
ncbi:hypothetical protein PQX77_005285 [Marasmius sp. AFHP31]|nr:hypothetical protein PQX77_005285 [Marasmius sp. AFHP31]